MKTLSSGLRCLVLAQRQVPRLALFASSAPRSGFARVVRTQSVKSQVAKQELNEQAFSFSEGTFRAILSALESAEDKTSFVANLRESDLSAQLLSQKNAPADRAAFISCLQVIGICDYFNPMLRKRMAEHCVNLMQVSSSSGDLGVIIAYFLQVQGQKQYMKELEAVFVQGIEQLTEVQLRSLVSIYSDNYMGSVEFYAAIQKQLLALWEEPSTVSSLLILKHYLPVFTKSNYFSSELQNALHRVIGERLSEKKYLEYPNETVMPYAKDLLNYFALHYESTSQFHDQLLKVIRETREQSKTIPKGVTKALGVFLHVAKHKQPSKQVDDFFKPTQKVRHTIIRESLSQQEVTPFVLELIPSLHLKENHTIGVYNVDYYAEVSGKKIVLEVNGRYHYFHKRRSGDYAVKYQCLQADGCTVCELNEYDWKKATTVDQKKSLIKSILANHLTTNANK